jgi:hypothetical protein
MRRDDVDEDVDEEEEDGGGGDDDDEQAELVADEVRRKVMAALPRAIAEVARVVRANHKFPSDDVRRACVALLRLAPKLFAREKVAPADDSCLGYHPSNTPERAAMLLRRLQRSHARAARGEGEDPNWKPFEEDES